MKSIQHSTPLDEHAHVDCGGPGDWWFAAVVVWLFGLWANTGYWMRTKRVCSWCLGPRPLNARPPSRWQLRGWMGGNPIARRVTHGVCPRCREKFFNASIKP